MGDAAKQAFGAPRAGLVIAGLEVPHMHIHVFPAWALEDFSFANTRQADDDEPDQVAGQLRAALGQG